QHDVLRRGERRVPDETSRSGREEVRLAQRGQLALEGLPVRPHPQVDVLPVIEPGAAHLALVERKAERLDKMEGGAGREARAPSVAGIPVNLWMHEDDVYRH